MGGGEVVFYVGGGSSDVGGAGSLALPGRPLGEGVLQVHQLLEGRVVSPYQATSCWRGCSPGPPAVGGEGSLTLPGHQLLERVFSRSTSCWRGG